MTGRPRSGATRGAPLDPLLLAAVVLGWVVFDLAFLSASGGPRLALAILPSSLALVLAGALLGVATMRVRALLPGLLVALALASILPKLVHIGWSDSFLWIPRDGVLLALGLLAARRFGLATALAAGFCLAAAVGLYRMGVDASQALTLGLLALPALAVLLLPRTKLRSGVRLLSLAAILLFTLWSTRYRTALRRADLPSRAATPERDGRRANLLLIVLDTVRADHLAPYGAARETTPTIDRFVSEAGTVFESARSASSWTLPAHASLLTGLFPDEHGATRPRTKNDSGALTLQAWPAQRLSPDVPTLAEILRTHGYRTGAIVGNTSFLRFEYGLDRGFEHYDDRSEPYLPRFLALAQLGGRHPRVGFLPYREAARVSDLAEAWLAEPGERPFFLFLNYMDAHLPCIPPAPFDRLFSDETPADPRAPRPQEIPLLYDRELAHVDFEVGRVLAWLERAHLLDDTTVVITSDHGEAFGEHGFTAHGWNLFEETVRVPLFVRHAGDTETKRSTEPISGTDVLGLALASLGIDAPELHGTGAPTGMIGQVYLTDRLVNIWRERGADVDHEQIAWIEGTRKWILDAAGRVRAFDLASDPGEMRPLTLSQEERAAARAEAERWWAAHPPDSTGILEVEGAEKERLRDLGYF